MGQQDEINGNTSDGEVDGNKLEDNTNGNSTYKGGGNRPYPRKTSVPFKQRVSVSGRDSKIEKRKDDADEVMKKRNKRIIDFFKLVGLSVNILGNENTPAIVYNDSCILNAYVHNFELRFTDHHNQGNVIYTIKLTEKPSFDKNRVMNCINDYEKRPVFKVAVKGSNPRLYLSGYNFLNKDEKLGRYPVFASYNPKVFFTKEKTDDICEELNIDGYSLETI